MSQFYRETVQRLLAKGTIDERSELLVVCGAELDRDVLQQCGLKNVTISNLDTRRDGARLAPYQWSYQNAEQLTFDDDSFDFSLVHAGLHHCRSPHRALLEMYRVARHGLALFEPYDNLVTRLGVALGIGQEFEHAAVFYNGGTHGGVANSGIPNYVHRWTERELIKTINAYAPVGKHEFEFIHELAMPWTQLRGRKNRSIYYAALAAAPALVLVRRICRRQGNNFAAIVRKPQLPADLHPWLVSRGRRIEPDLTWLKRRYLTLDIEDTRTAQGADPVGFAGGPTHSNATLPRPQEPRRAL